MKKHLISTGIILFLCLLLGGVTSCTDKKKTNNITTQRPLNISIYIDLSDRLVRDMQPSQVSRDTAAIG